MKNDDIASWLIRMLKGAFIGTGFILPGISGGALAAVFGLYERMIKFLADIRKDFRENLFFFLPVGIGGLMGIFIFSVVLSLFFEMAETQIIWFFIGCIVGTLPSLWSQAGREGRRKHHVAILIICFTAALLFLQFIEAAAGGAMPLNIYTWAVAGALIAFGAVVPGLSTSTLLIFLGLYAPMTRGIADLDLYVIIPIGIGGAFTIIAFSRMMAFVLDRAYSALFHGIVGFVLASTILIIPIDYDYFSIGGLLCLMVLILGILLALWMCGLEDRYK